MPAGHGRRLLVLLLPAALACALVPAAMARGRGRVRIGGRGLPSGANYAGPTLSRPELSSCVQQERSVNTASEALEREERAVSAAQGRVDSYSQDSVDSFNRQVDSFNRNVNSLNGQVRTFNATCADRAYYESDMSAVLRELGGKR